MGALLGNTALIQDKGAVGTSSGAEAVGDEDDGTAFAQEAELLVRGPFGVRVEGRGRFVTDWKRRVGAEEGPRDGEALPLAAGEVMAAPLGGGEVGVDIDGLRAPVEASARRPRAWSAA